MSALPDINDPAAVASWNRAAIGFLRHTLDRVMLPFPSLRLAANSGPRPSFDKRVEEVKVPKSEINALILDYLTTEGYANAAAKFSKEANLEPQQEDAFMQSRQDIRNAVLRGNIQGAIEALNELDPEILDRDPTLHFMLLRMQLIELIRACNVEGGDITPALTFAREQLGPRAPQQKKYLEDLEQTMALLLVPQDALEPHLASLLGPQIRRDVAEEVNKAILSRHAIRREAAIRRLVKMRAWAENTIRGQDPNFPEHIHIGLFGDDNTGESHQDANAENGHDSMIMT